MSEGKFGGSCLWRCLFGAAEAGGSTRSRCRLRCARVGSGGGVPVVSHFVTGNAPEQRRYGGSRGTGRARSGAAGSRSGESSRAGRAGLRAPRPEQRAVRRRRAGERRGEPAAGRLLPAGRARCRPPPPRRGSLRRCSPLSLRPGGAGATAHVGQGGPGLSRARSCAGVRSGVTRKFSQPENVVWSWESEPEGGSGLAINGAAGGGRPGGEAAEAAL